VGTGTAQIPIEICKLVPAINFVGIDLAQAMLNLGLKNVHKAGLQTRIRLQLVDAKKLPFEDEKFAGVISNSIVHHIPKPRMVLKEIVRVVSSGGVIFIRDLLRPHSEEQVQHLVKTYAGDANAHQQKMFADSLRAALSLQEIQAMVNQLGFPADSVGATSDRHWTWAAKKNC
jgi:ubiquinone/menaquinone biosynthesis C-methylase UbiE